ncbi:hypothetical protein [Terrisporobacter sp.]
MSRLKKLKNKVKTTFCCLTLAFIMGIPQGIGTYALFTDNEDVPSDISLSTGDVDVEVSEGKKFIEVEPEDKINIPIRITNNGTLNQNISLDFSISKDIEEYLIYEFVFDEITIKNGVMYNGEKLFVLSPGKSILGEAKITVAKELKDKQNDLCGTEKSIDIIVKSTQINKDNTLMNNGFYDVAIQKNTMSIAQKEVITIATGEKAYFTNGGGNSFKKLYIPINVKSTTGKVTLEARVVSNSGSHIYAAIYGDFPPYGDYILIQSQNKQDELPFKGVVNISIKVTVDGEESYDLDCNVTLENAGNNCSDNHPDHYEGTGSGNGKKCHGEVVYSGLKEIDSISGKSAKTIKTEVVNQLNEEMKEVSESQAVDQLKEDVEKSNQP